jgi:hypothetical protein
MADGSWVDRQAGRITFIDHAEHWWPSRYLEVSIRAAYRCNLDGHFLAFFGAHPLVEITPSLAQQRVGAALDAGLSPGRWSSTTPCCTASSNAPCLTG